MKQFRAAIHQLDVVSLDTVLQVVKQTIHPNTQIFNLLSLHPPITIDEPFQKGNQYAMLEDGIVSSTIRTVVATSDSDHYGRSKGKRGRDD